MKSELMNCPFCGGKAVSSKDGSQDGDFYVVECEACFDVKFKCLTEAEAITQWNTRAPSSQWVDVKDDLPQRGTNPGGC